MERVLAEKLEELLTPILWLRNCHVDRIEDPLKMGFELEAKLQLPKAEAILAVACKKELRPSAFPALAERKLALSGRRWRAVPVLAMPYVSPRLADLCVQNGWSWYDLAGNCHLDVPDAIYVERRGNLPAYRRPRPKANLSTPEAARVIRALLAPDNAGARWTQRGMATHFGELGQPASKPSLGLVNKVVQHLREEAFVEAFPDGGFRLRDPVKLLYAWRDAYRFDRHQRLDYFSLLQGKEMREALYDLGLYAGGFAAYAAFSAADVQAPHVRQPRTWLYVADKFLGQFEELLAAKRVESGENLVVLLPDDAGVFYMADAGTVEDSRMASTNPVQTYVDLAHCGGRGKEAAEALLVQRLKPVWGAHKLL
jgi:hypothetical protein